jgi:hypothetical protein
MRAYTWLFAVGLIAQTALSEEVEWPAQVLIDSAHGMGGAAIGDLDRDRPGNEVVVVNSAGEVWLAYEADSKWKSERIYKGEGEFIMCAIGDVDPRHAGSEFVGVGMVQGEESRNGPGQVVMLWEESGQWKAEQIFQDDHMIHGVAIGDASAGHAGNEVITCGFNHRVTLLSQVENGWQSEVIYVGNDRMKVAAIADLLPERKGLEVVVAGSDGKVLTLWEDQLGWKHEVVYSDRVGQSRVACGELNVLIGGDEGKVTLAERSGGQWVAEFLARQPGKIRGVAIADVDDAFPGTEMYACGYSRNVVQIVNEGDVLWDSRVIYRAERPLHHLVAGDVDRRHPGPELITCGHGGKLILLTPPRP